MMRKEIILAEYKGITFEVYFETDNSTPVFNFSNSYGPLFFSIPKFAEFYYINDQLNMSELHKGSATSKKVLALMKEIIDEAHNISIE